MNVYININSLVCRFHGLLSNQNWIFADMLWYASKYSYFLKNKINFQSQTNGIHTPIPQRYFAPKQKCVQGVIILYINHICCCAITSCSHHILLERANHATQLIRKQVALFFRFSQHMGYLVPISRLMTNNRKATGSDQSAGRNWGEQNHGAKLFSCKSTIIWWI